MNNSNVQSLFNDVVDEQDDVFLNNYATLYYSRLTNNFPINSHGTCSYVSISLLLSFFDSYWDDAFVSNTFQQNSFFDDTANYYQKVDMQPFDIESPGVISENNNEVQNLSLYDYQSFVLSNYNTYFQSFLIKTSYDLFDRYCFENNANPYGMTLYEQTHLLSYYLTYKITPSNGAAYVTSCINNIYNDIENFIVSRLVNGIPVLINTNTNVGPHTVVAYDYDSINQTIYVHSGWKDGNGNALTHVSLEQLGASSQLLDSAVAIDYNGNHGYHSFHYHSSSNSTYCSCRMIYPSNIRAYNNTFFDTPPTFRWDSLYEEKWFDYYTFYIEVSILNHCHNPLITKNVYVGNECTLTNAEWDYVINYDAFNYYYVNVSLKCLNYPYNILENYSFKQFPKPSMNNQKTILTTDYTGYGDYYETRFNVDQNFAVHTTTSGFQFRTRRYRAGYIHNEFVTISPKRLTYKRAFIEYQFYRPIDRIDIELSLWRENEYEGLDPENDVALFQEYRYGEYNILLDLLDPENELSEDRNDMSLYTFYFEKPISRLRLYAETYRNNFNNDNRGRISVGTIIVYENPYSNSQYPIATTGYEKQYQPNLWNGHNDVDNYNCYCYALNYKAPEGTLFSPGYVGAEGNYVWYHLNNCYYEIDSFVFCANADSSPGILTNTGFVFTLLQDKNEIINDVGAYRIALVFDLSQEHEDYHWYRQNPDGSWSHKPSTGIVRNYDFDGNPIYDPEFCNRKSNLNELEEKVGHFEHDYYSEIYYFKVQGFDLGI